ncbi:MAG: response regulator transcription factor [Gammaproteobacteria bacterium]
MRILIVEDDEVLRDGLSRSMKASYAVDCATNGKEAVQMACDGCYDLVILDLGLPQMDGLAVLKQLRSRNLNMPVIILTARDGVEDRVKGLDLGADDYLVKPFSLPELEARVRALLRRGQGGRNPVISCGALAFDSVGRRVTIDGEYVELSQREMGVLEVLLTRVGKVVSKEQLLDHLYNHDEEVSGNAIEVYVHRLRKKIESAGVTIRTIRGLGYLMDNV